MTRFRIGAEREIAMSDERAKDGSAQPTQSEVAEPLVTPATAQASPATAAPEATSTGEKLDSVEEIDFLLEEIESKIAPLALA
jgi:hypothetical protein